MMVDMVKSIDRMYVGTTTVRSKYVCVQSYVLTEPRRWATFVHCLLDSVTSRNLNHDLRVKTFFLDHVTSMRGF